jgi:hypothetical protein
MDRRLLALRPRSTRQHRRSRIDCAGASRQAPVERRNPAPTRSACARSAIAAAGVPPALVGPGGVQNDRLAESEQALCTPQQLPVRALRPDRRIEPGTVGGGCGTFRTQPGKFLAQPVRSQHRHAELIRESTGKSGLARSGQPPDEDQRHGRGSQMPVRQLCVFAGIGGSFEVTLGTAQAGDLGPHIRPVCHVVVQQGRWCGIAGELDVPTEKLGGQIRCPRRSRSIPRNAASSRPSR